MNTDDLIEQLAKSATPVPPNAARRRTAGLVALGALGAAAIVGLWLGLRPDLARAVTGMMFWVKLIYCLALMGAAAAAVDRLARPGGRVSSRLVLLAAAPFAVVVIIAVIQLIAAPDNARALVMGASWRVCPFLIAVTSIPLFIAAQYGARRMAPTNLHAAGLAAGLLAGAAAAAIYSFHCPEPGAPFLAIWYTSGVLLVGLIGWALGPRILRW